MPGFEGVLPTANRMTMADALSGLIWTLKGHQLDAQKAQALKALQAQRVREQNTKSQAEYLSKLDPGQLASIYQTLPPEVQARVPNTAGVPSAAPKPMSEAEIAAQKEARYKSQAAYIATKVPPEQLPAVYAQLPPEVQQYIPNVSGIKPAGPKPMSEAEQQRAEIQRQQLADQQKRTAAYVEGARGKAQRHANYFDTSRADFVEHPAVKPYNDTLRHLHAQYEAAKNGTYTVGGYALSSTDREQLLGNLTAAMQQLIKERQRVADHAGVPVSGRDAAERFHNQPPPGSPYTLGPMNNGLDMPPDEQEMQFGPDETEPTRPETSAPAGGAPKTAAEYLAMHP